MAKETITCPCGKKVKISSGCGQTIGDQQTESGFKFIPTHNQKNLWLCPKCHKKAREHAKALFDVVKDEYILYYILFDKE